MKKRDGFVSNSSSSSFVIAWKGIAPGERDIFNEFGISEDSPIVDIVWELARFIANHISSDYCYVDATSYIDHECYGEREEANEIALELLEQRAGWNVVVAGLINDGSDGWPEIAIYESGIDIEAKDLIVKGGSCR